MDLGSTLKSRRDREREEWIAKNVNRRICLPVNQSSFHSSSPATKPLCLVQESLTHDSLHAMSLEWDGEACLLISWVLVSSETCLFRLQWWDVRRVHLTCLSHKRKKKRKTSVSKSYPNNTNTCNREGGCETFDNTKFCLFSLSMNNKEWNRRREGEMNRSMDMMMMTMMIMLLLERVSCIPWLNECRWLRQGRIDRCVLSLSLPSYPLLCNVSLLLGKHWSGLKRPLPFPLSISLQEKGEGWWGGG